MQCTDCIAIQCYALNERHEGNIIYKLINIMYMYVSKNETVNITYRLTCKFDTSFL